MGETYLAAFALALGMSDLVSGLVSTVPLCVGGLLQLIAPIGLARVGSHRRWVVGCATLQALSFAPLVAGALLGRFSVLLLYTCAALYWASGMATGPAWNIWIGRLVLGGGGPTCNPWVFEDFVYKWEAVGDPVEAGTYELRVHVVLDDPESDEGHWGYQVEIKLND